MSIRTDTELSSCLAAPAPPRVRVRRLPFYLVDSPAPVFAWLHVGDSPTAMGRGVVLCPPIGHEQLHSHRTFRHLADGLAERGFTVLRIDYHGTGDSPGSDEDPDRWPTWLANIRAAARWLREHGGSAAVSLVGLRIGATLAMLAAAEEPVDDLVLWAPVIKGSLYVRELKAISRTSAATANLASATDAVANGDSPAARRIEAGGFVLSGATADVLSRVQLTDVRPQARRLLLVQRDDSAAPPRFVEYLGSLGIAHEQLVATGYADMLAMPHETRVPHQALHQIADWLDREPPAGTVDPGPATPEAPPPTPASLVVPGPGGVPLRKSAWMLHDDPDLFGLVCEPEHGVPAERPLIMLLNAGSSHHVGPSRLYVLLARRLAELGFRSLRLDFCGLGDSVTTVPAAENDPYPATAFRDIGLAWRRARERYGAQRLVLAGLCSGAYAAFQYAAQCQDATLVESILINPLTFFWQDGMTLESPSPSRWDPWLHYLNAAMQPAKWKRLLSGSSRLGVTGTLKAFVQRVGFFQRSRSSAPATGGSGDVPECSVSSLGEWFGHPASDDLRSDLHRIAAAGHHLSMFFATSDPGHFILKMRAGRKAKQLQRDGKLDIAFIDNADHTFSAQHARDALLAAVEQHLSRRYLAGHEA